jgi:hypothetical protein
MCTLTIEIARNTRLTYEEELLNFKIISHFYKTNHPGFPAAVHATPVKWGYSRVLRLNTGEYKAIWPTKLVI